MKITSRLHLLLNEFGFYPKHFFNSVKGIPAFLNDLSALKQQLKNSSEDFQINEYYPQLKDRYDTAGAIPLHYFYQDIFAAGKIFKNNPVKHVDIGSRIDGFAAHVASFREIEIFDIRNLNLGIANMKFVQADLMSDNFPYTDYCDSISCLHAIEHFGLGRYGEPVDVNGYRKGLNNIYKMLKSGGRFYFSTPIGEQRIEFNAHRVFSVGFLLSLFKDNYELKSFSFVDDNNNFHPEVKLNDEDIKNNFGCTYGCGIFELQKL